MTVGRARALALGLGLAAWILAGGVALGHGLLVRSEPAPESASRRSPDEVRLHFTERLEAAYSWLRVEDERGRRVDRVDGRVDPSNPVLLRATLPRLAPGTYTVIWRVLSVDSHVTQGRFTFRVE